jgi:hypothetical protein
MLERKQAKSTLNTRCPQFADAKHSPGKEGFSRKGRLAFGHAIIILIQCNGVRGCPMAPGSAGASKSAKRRKAQRAVRDEDAMDPDSSPRRKAGNDFAVLLLEAADDGDDDAPAPAPAPAPLQEAPTTKKKKKKQQQEQQQNKRASKHSASQRVLALAADPVEPADTDVGADADAVVMKLAAGEAVTFHGAVRISVEEGIADLFGYRLTPQLRRGVCAVSLSSRRPTPRAAVDAFSPKWAPRSLLQVLPLTDSTIRFAECPTAWLCEADEATTASTASERRRVPGCCFVAEPAGGELGPLTIPDDWREAAATVCAEPRARVATCGARNVGKSTLSRFICNQLLSRCARTVRVEWWLTVWDGEKKTAAGGPAGDRCGSERVHAVGICRAAHHSQTAAGTAAHALAASSPVCWCLTAHYRAADSSQPPSRACICRSYFIGDVSVGDPAHYVACVKKLVNYYDSKFAGSDATTCVPLVVNTQGWVTGARDAGALPFPVRADADAAPRSGRRSARPSAGLRATEARHRNFRCWTRRLAAPAPRVVCGHGAARRRAQTGRR